MKKQLLPPILKNDQGFAIIIFAITIVILIAFGIANIDMGASNKGKETIKNIIQTKGGEELARVLRLKTLKIKERLLVGTSSARSAVEADYRCSSGSSIDTPSSHTVEVVDPQQSIIFICKLSQNSGEDGYLLSAYLKRREEIQKRFSQLFINKRQGSVGFISRVIGSVSRTRDSGENGSLLKHSPLFIGDLITTGSSSTTTLELKDKSSIVLGASTTFKIDDFKFKTKQQRVGVFTATAGFIKAWIRKKSENQRVIFKTNSAAMGIRGTVFSLNVAKLNATTGQFIDDVMLEEGWIELKDINQNVVIAQLKMAYQNASTVTEVDGYTNGYTGGGSTT
ncbi:MAG: hypothetical protein HN730_12620, partial [Bdellovibrionales bacterium]|nr:hypothetical protein [Bdellovibrionales bacterium]